MATFIVCAALLALVVFAGVLWPLWKSAPKFALGLLLALCVGTFALYEIVGTPRALDARNRVAQVQSPENPDELVQAAFERMKADPRRRADAQAVALLERALELDPRNQRGRWFFGVVLRQNGQAAQAAALWETLLPELDATTAASLREQIDAARRDAGLPPLPAADTKGLAIKLDIAPDLRKRFGGDATVFVLARIPNGPPMPVAVQKHALSELPLTVTLGDADSPMPTQKLSSLHRIEVVARVSASGDALHADAQSAPVQLDIPRAAPVELRIDR